MDVNLILAVAVLMMVVGAVFIYTLLGRRPGWKPQDATEWTGSAMSLALIVSSGALIVMALGTSAEAPVMYVAAGASQPEITDMALSTQAGDFTFTALESGEEMSLASLQGKVVLLNFWATWCPPCLQEIPELNQLADRYPDDLVILSLSDEDPETLASFEEGFEMTTFSSYVPEGTQLPAPFSQAFNIRPTSFVIDRDGVVRRYLLGRRSYDLFERFVVPYM
jgi:thiol-disulfide isomerase/thioredoxin